MTILDELAAYAKERVQAAEKALPPAVLREQAFALPKGHFAFENALKTPDISFICECKKASPSKGLIAPDFPYLRIAREYEAAGADAISVLTEPKWFLGSDEVLRQIAENVSIPCLRPGLFRSVSVKVIFELTAAAGMAEFAECLCLNLADTLTGDIELLAYLFQGPGTAVLEAETQTEHFLLTLCQCAEHLIQLFLEKGKSGCLSGDRDIVVLNEIAEVAVLFLADGSLKGDGLLRNAQFFRGRAFRRLRALSEETAA